MNETETSSDELRLLEWANVMLAHRFFIVLMTIAAGLAAYGLCKMAQPLYMAETTLIPNREAETRSLERMLDANLQPTQYFDRFSATYVSSYYMELLRSDALLRPLAERTWAGSQTLAQLFELRERPRATLADQALVTLRKQVIRIRQDNATGMLSVQCTTPDPVVSAELAQALVEGLKEQLKKSRTAGTSELVKATEQRTSVAQVALDHAEKALQDYRLRNKTRLSPDLKLREEQLQREVKVQEELFIKLETLLAVLRVGEKQETALINIIQPAEAPLRKSWPPTMAATLGSALFGFLLATAIAFLRRGIRRLAERNAPGYEEFARHVRTLNYMLPGVILLLPRRRSLARRQSAVSDQRSPG
jgi:uncharacterized protein involved in exopolysaccharide biosynthesis